MRQDELELIQDITVLQKDQRYLLDKPDTPQQAFLHLFGHRHLLSKTIFNKNLDQIMCELEGTFSQSALKLNYEAFCIDNHIKITNESQLSAIIQSWINYYPTIRTKNQYLLCDIVLQGETVDKFMGYNQYITYLNLISLDLWKLIRRNKKQDQFMDKVPFKEDLNQIAKDDLSKFEPSDILTFISSCLSKTLINIILDKDGMPHQIIKKHQKYQCLYSNQQAEYFLRINTRVAIFLKQLFMVLISFENKLTKEQQKFMMILIMRFYEIYHPFKGLNSAQIFIFGFNSIDVDVRQKLKDEFSLFIKMMIKIGKEKLLQYLEKNAGYFRRIIQGIRKNPMIGYSQQAVSPYNTMQLGQTITIQPGKSATRIFEILEPWSLFFFHISLQSQDITVKLYYLGDITAPKTSKTMLFTQQKIEGEFKSCINTIKRGLYMFQFDNTYSWLNSKTIVYENLVYTPLQIQVKNAYEWSYDFYEDILQNEIAKDEDLFILTHEKQQKHQKKQQTNYNDTIGIAYVSKQDEIFTLKLRKKTHQIVYETDNPERMEQRVKEVIAGKAKFKWSVMNKIIDDFSEIDNFVRGIENPAHNKKEYQHVSTLEREVFGNEDEDNDDVEYEVVQKSMKKDTQTINESRLQDKKVKVAKEKKEEISWSNEQTADFYNDESES